MKDKEMAEEYANEKCKDCYMCSYSEHKNPYKVCQRRKDRKQGFLAGLKAGRPQWHDLRKNPDDYPKHNEDFFSISEMVIIKEENKKRGALAYYCYDDQAWSYWDTDGYVENKIIAWHEMPKFEENQVKEEEKIGIKQG